MTKNDSPGALAGAAGAVGLKSSTVSLTRKFTRSLRREQEAWRAMARQIVRDRVLLLSPPRVAALNDDQLRWILRRVEQHDERCCQQRCEAAVRSGKRCGDG